MVLVQRAGRFPEPAADVARVRVTMRDPRLGPTGVIDTGEGGSHRRWSATSRDRDTTMLDSATIDALARAYHIAEKERRRTRAPSVLNPGFTTEDAYAVQRAWVKIKLGEGNVIKGHKIGLTSRAMQRASAINEPDYSSLMADMFYNTGEEIPMSRFIQPRLECELGFVMGRRLRGPNCTIFDVLNAVDYVIPSAEIVDGRTHRVDPETNQPR
jgi:2-oxo-hept-3-ene-1,7-dioate hydratase